MPSPRRRRDGGPWEKRIPAAMAAGIADHVWDAKELIEAADAFRELRLRSAVDDSFSAGGGLPGEAFEFWINYSPSHRRANVHTSACTSCNGGSGKREKMAKVGEWLGFETLADAKAHAARLEPDNHGVCKLCIGSYNTSQLTVGGHETCRAHRAP